MFNAIAGTVLILGTTAIAPAPAIAQLAPTPAVPAGIPAPAVVPTAPPLHPQATASDDAYTLGAGDRIQVDIFDVPEFSGANGQHTVQVDGSLELPWVGQVFVVGQTVTEAAETLTMAYAPYIREPLLTVRLLTPRPLRIGVMGEVNRPGAYTVSLSGDGTTLQWQTVTQAIQLAGGITQTADIRQIQVRRSHPLQGEERIDLDLWSFLQAGDLSQDMTLRDGDTVIIPTATALAPAEAAQLAAANFSPATITVNVVGEVVSPGSVTVPPNTPLNQAILAAGGFDRRRAQRGEVELIRFNANGTVSKRSIDIDLAAGLNDETNPALRHNDTLIIGRSQLTSVSDFIGGLLNPLSGFFGILRLFQGL